MRAQSCRAIALAALAAATVARAADFYVDPVAGADRGDGSSARPWRSLQAVIDQQVETRNWASLPWTGQALVASHPGAPVKAGDTIWLRSGDHGALEIVGAYNTAPVTVAAEPGATPRLTGLRIRSAARWVVRGLSVSPWYGTPPAFRAIATVEDHDWTGPVSDVVLDGLEIFTVPDEAAWATAADWDAGSWDGVLADGDRAVVRNCRVRNVNYGIAVTGVGSRVEHNLVDGFCGDGLRGLGDDEVFEYNLVKNAREVNADHRDGFQSWSYGAGGVGTGVVRNVTLRGNVIVAWESPAVRFAGTLQGIGCFDGTYDGWVVENNVVITDHWHGISFHGATNLRIVNNTVLDLNAVDPGPPWIMLTAHKDGTPSRDAVVRNNLATDLSVDGTNVVADGNLILPGGRGRRRGVRVRAGRDQATGRSCGARRGNSHAAGPGRGLAGASELRRLWRRGRRRAPPPGDRRRRRCAAGAVRAGTPTAVPHPRDARPGAYAAPLQPATLIEVGGQARRAALGAQSPRWSSNE